MITALSKDELVGQGAGLRGSQLVTQAGYTLGIAADDGAALEALLPPGYLAEVLQAKAQVETACSDKANAAEESKDATRGQNDALRAIKVWRRRVVARGRRARRIGQKVPDAVTVITGSATVGPVLKQVSEMTGSMRACLAIMGTDAQALLDEGVRLHDQLAAIDSDQERKRLSALPAKVRDYFAAKGLLHTGLKVINDAGQELHADNPAAAGRYNLRVLYRHVSTKPAAKPTPATPG